MKIKNKLVIPLIILSVVFFFVVGFLNFQTDRQVIPVSFVLSENSGFGNAEGEIIFGALKYNQSAARSIVVSNDYDYDIFIKIKIDGEIRDRVIASENNFVLSPNESREVTFTVYSHGLTEYRKYSGNIIILSRKD